ncbi:hypothetical protein GGR61_002294 [Xanthomonas arboricola]|nr:hypothetical protein [Xanthomonas sp. 3058]
MAGSQTRYWDDSGFTADGSVVTNDALQHAGMRFHRRRTD